MDLKPGDLFLTASSGFLYRIIMAIQRFWSQDDQAQYSHAGIVLNQNGDIFEATGKGITEGSFYDHAGKPVLIARHSDMDLALFQHAFEKIYKLRGNPYPVHRLFFHLFPPIAKYWGVGMAVCSELVAEFLYFADILDYWMGVNPEELEEIFRHWKDFEIVYEGILPEKEKQS